TAVVHGLPKHLEQHLVATPSRVDDAGHSGALVLSLGGAKGPGVRAPWTRRVGALLAREAVVDPLAKRLVLRLHDLLRDQRAIGLAAASDPIEDATLVGFLGVDPAERNQASHRLAGGVAHEHL